LAKVDGGAFGRYKIVDMSEVGVFIRKKKMKKMRR